MFDNSSAIGTNSRITLASIISSRNVSGPVKVLLKFLADARRQDYRVIVKNIIAAGDSDYLLRCEADREGITIDTLFRRPGNYLGLAAAAGKTLPRETDIVETHSFLPTFVGAWMKHRYTIPWVCYLHGTTRENFRVKVFHILDSWLQLYADRVILVSEGQRRLIPKGFDSSRVRVIHNSVDPAAPAPLSAQAGPLRERFQLDPSTRTLAVVGRLSPEKGVDVFINALSVLAKQHVKVFAFIVGDGPSRSALEAMVGRLGLTKMVQFTGLCTTPGDYLAFADCVVLPSRSEGIPNVILEALAFKRPVVATAVGGVPEIIRSGIEGVLVPSEKPDQLAAAIRSVLDNDNNSLTMGHRGFKRMVEEFSPERRHGEILALYRDVIAHRVNTRRSG